MWPGILWLVAIPLPAGGLFLVWYEQDYRRVEWLFPLKGRWLRRFLLIVLTTLFLVLISPCVLVLLIYLWVIVVSALWGPPTL